LHGLGRSLLVDQLFVGGLRTSLHESSVVVGNDLVGIPSDSILTPQPPENFVVHHAIDL
jgi:hypothetical protein